jgi:serine/threonine protein kinase
MMEAKRGLLMPLYPATLHNVPRPMDETYVLDCGRQLKATLDAIHREGYGHNDIKAGNVFLDQNGENKYAMKWKFIEHEFVTLLQVLYLS